ncbi:hypothetical protein D3C73_1624240 [compost metagenome]
MLIRLNQSDRFYHLACTSGAGGSHQQGIGEQRAVTLRIQHKVASGQCSGGDPRP